MCLITDKKEPLIAIEDIVCYKIIKLSETQENVWEGVYTYHKFPLGKKITAPEKPKVEWWPIPPQYHVSEGFFHAKTSLEELQDIIFQICYRGIFEELKLRYPFMEVKCIIPKGTEYFISIDNKEICARSMIICKNLKEGYKKYARTKFDIAVLHSKVVMRRFLHFLNKLTLNKNTGDFKYNETE